MILLDASNRYSTLRIRREFIQQGDPNREIKLLYASDLHLQARSVNWVCNQLITATALSKPDAILLGGDLVDGKTGIQYVGNLVQQLRTLAPLGAVPGNHDYRAGVTAVRDAVLGGGGCWLPDCPMKIQGQSSECLVSGRIVDNEPHDVLCAHDPSILPAAVAAGFNIVLAGHLHGGQVILCTIGGRFYPGALLSRWTGPRFTVGTTTMIVSNGIHDTIPFRFNCPREVILCQV